jgi:hypothetical protein
MFHTCTSEMQIVVLDGRKVSNTWQRVPYDEMCDGLWDSLAVGVYTLFLNPAGRAQCGEHCTVKRPMFTRCQVSFVPLLSEKGISTSHAVIRSGRAWTSGSLLPSTSVLSLSKISHHIHSSSVMYHVLRTPPPTGDKLPLLRHHSTKNHIILRTSIFGHVSNKLPCLNQLYGYTSSRWPLVTVWRHRRSTYARHVLQSAVG